MEQTNANRIERLKQPTYILEVSYTADNEAANACAVSRPSSFVQLKHTFGTRLAFHGSSVENFYSILRSGFCGNLNR